MIVRLTLLLLLLLCLGVASAFQAAVSNNARRTQLFGYLDDLSKEVYKPDGNPDIEADSKDATNMAKDQLDRFGPGSFDQYVDFGDEFDGGDGRTYN